jgi:hypothetical protein
VATGAAAACAGLGEVDGDALGLTSVTLGARAGLGAGEAVGLMGTVAELFLGPSATAPT